MSFKCPHDYSQWANAVEYAKEYTKDPEAAVLRCRCGAEWKVKNGYGKWTKRKGGKK